jgi:predicted phage replisome organizer
MASVKWIKITTDIFDDEKMRLIDALPEADTIIVIWFKLLAQAGKTNQNGALLLNHKIAYNDDMLATIFNRKVSSIRLALDTFENLNMIERGDYIQISNWGKHQNIEGMDKIRQQTRERVSKYREKKKLLEEPKNNETLRNVTVTHLEEELEEELDKELKDIKSRGKFSPPTIEEVIDYCKKRKNNIDPNRWFNFYLAKNWMIGKNKMKDWKAAVRTWENSNNNKEVSTNAKSQEPITPYVRREDR